MRRLILFASLVALLGAAGAAPLPQASDKTQARDGASQLDAMEARDAEAAEPLEKGDSPQGLLTLQPSAGKEPQGAEVKDILGVFRSPLQGPELDRDRLYHPRHEEAPAEDPRPQAWLLPLQVSWGPEEDRDHIYHPAEPGPGGP
ncbi:proline-rich acidic protein 1 [Dasypus novemcinctus]|uniref:proline-rich acidic protein 1 n=1 Tax=Dasypus novemcinctus TaxID=9361 RepID=UPI000328D7AF|nr:proline-rich acidic protein 1 [Dasypus novemcinctus]